jgi:hypothetical protein
MFPVRVVVETVRDTECVGCAENGPVLADSYAIVSGHTALSQLVDTVLAALGLQQLAYGAKGTCHFLVVPSRSSEKRGALSCLPEIHCLLAPPLSRPRPRARLL